MYAFSSQANFYIQIFIGVILVGVFYNIWSSTKAYGGLIGMAIRLLGVGMLFVTISVFERILINTSIIAETPTLSLAQDIMNLIGLAFLGIGFSKLGSATKT